MTWENLPHDIDIHVMALGGNGPENSTSCKTYYGNTNGCEAINLDWDNTGTGIDGPETITLTNKTINGDNVYVVAVTHHQRNGTDFLSSKTHVRFENSVQSETIDIPTDVSIDDKYTNG